MRTLSFEDVVSVVDELMKEGKSFTSKDVTALIRSKGIHAMNQDVGELLRNNWAYLSDETSYQRTAIKIAPNITTWLYQPQDNVVQINKADEAIQKSVEKLVANNEPYNLKTVLEGASFLHAPLMERRRISDWLRRNIPAGYTMEKDGLGNKYVPTTFQATLTTTYPDGSRKVATMSREEAMENFSRIAADVDAAFNEALIFFNRKLSEADALFSAILK
jgi:hypothetical protein